MTMQSVVLLVLAAEPALFAASPTAAGPGGGHRAVPVLTPAPVARIPFSSAGGLLLIPVRVNGSRELNMILDTGMSAPIVMLMHREMRDELGLGQGQRAEIGGAGGQRAPQGRVYTGATVSFGPLEQPVQTLIVMDEAREASSWMQDGIIGKTIFDRYVVDIDYEASVVSLYEPATFAARGFESIPISLQTGTPILEAEVEGDDGRKIPLRLVVDLGAGHALSVHPDATTPLDLPARTIPFIIGKGIQGDVEGRIGRIRALRVGPFAFSGVLTSFPGAGSGVGLTRRGVGADGNLGSRFLRRFRVVVDYPHQRILLAPRPGYDRPFEHNMAGLVLWMERAGGLLVRSVMESSPAAKAGIAPGDRIVAIGDWRLGPIGPRDPVEEFLRDGATLRLTVERGGQRFERNVTLRRLI